ncbi:NAD(P)/FAD-dependent oxidoreductase [Rivibacter subsaxonicus]|uniref:Gamma-glutamylputrescine oxidase n=1 Tax=Rivibacter subsaxonicus TaxID=457575 RepID=A0A4Q7VDJ6_9BURK|nr:FAD-binding oxidoreductase [Rivibacter subsaxonicus]RZT93820.1 gamma-glutamylputrescine oxidase [Rivibacter subsaxonicus]
MSLLRADQDLTRASYYAASAPREMSFARLEGATETDVAIVGGGLAGLSAAIELADRGFSVTLLEAREIGWGASGRNGGQAIHGLACDQDTIEQQLGLDEARRVWAMSIEALDLIRQRIARFGIDCDWQDGYLGLAVNARKAGELRAWRDRMQQIYGYPLSWIDQGELPRWIASPRYVGGVHDPRSGHLHPLKYSFGLARAAASLGVRIHEGSAVTALEQGRAGQPCTVRTAGGSVRAQQVLLAGNVYLPEFGPALAPGLSARIMPVGTYIVCSEPLGRERCDALIPSRSAVCDTNFVLDYFRPTRDHRLLYGGRVSYSSVTPMNLADSMRRRMVGSFPQLEDVKIEHAWGGFVDISMNRAPDFGRLPAAGASKGSAASSVYYLQGFSGHGLALTGLAGKLVAEAMAGDASRFDTFARLRHRPFPGGRLLRTPALVLGMAYYRLKDAL